MAAHYRIIIDENEGGGEDNYLPGKTAWGLRNAVIHAGQESAWEMFDIGCRSERVVADIRDGGFDGALFHIDESETYLGFIKVTVDGERIALDLRIKVSPQRLTWAVIGVQYADEKS